MMETFFWYALLTCFIGTGILVILNYLIFLSPKRNRTKEEKELGFASSKSEMQNMIAHMFIPGLVFVLFPMCLFLFVSSLIALKKHQKIDYPAALNAVTNALDEYEKAYQNYESKLYHDGFIYEYDPNPQDKYKNAFYVLSAQEMSNFQEAVRFVVKNRHQDSIRTLCLECETSFLSVVDTFRQMKSKDSVLLSQSNAVVKNFVDQVNKISSTQENTNVNSTLMLNNSF